MRHGRSICSCLLVGALALVAVIVPVGGEGQTACRMPRSPVRRSGHGYRRCGVRKYRRHLHGHLISLEEEK
jgi:hypothetical protein